MINNHQIHYVLTRDDLEEILRDLLVGCLDSYFEHKTSVETPKPSDELRTRDETMAALRISSATLWRWKKSGYLQPVRVGSLDRYLQSDIDALLAKKGGSL